MFFWLALGSQNIVEVFSRNARCALRFCLTGQ
jgi:hypothetical protein